MVKTPIRGEISPWIGAEDPFSTINAKIKPGKSYFLPLFNNFSLIWEKKNAIQMNVAIQFAGQKVPEKMHN